MINSFSQDLQIAIDESWLAETMETPSGIIQCPICYQIPFQPVQCKECGRLFCKSDYKISKKSNDCCPNCKMSPWVLKEKLHLAYINILDRLAYHCRECKEKKKYKYNQLIEHLKIEHKMSISRYETKVFKYFIKCPNLDMIKLNIYQNLQIYQRKEVELSDQFSIFDAVYGIIQINIKNMEAIYTDPNKGVETKGTLIRELVTDPINDPQLNTKQNYIVWTVLNEKKYCFFLQQHQKMLEQGYSKYKQNPNFSEIVIDVDERGVRYRIDFKNMIQINLGTSFKRKIARTTIKINQF